MAWLERRGSRYRVKFRYGGQNHQVSLGSADRREAEGCLVRVEENLRLVERGRLDLPAGADLGLFLLSDGRREHKPILASTVGLGDVFRLYAETLTAGSKEASTRKSEGIHLRHLERLIGPKLPVHQFGTATVQEYVDRRAGEKHKGKLISPQTIRKEVATLQTVWNWAVRRSHVPTPCPTAGITFPKGREKTPFRTYDQIAAIVGRGVRSKAEVRELWDGLFLDRNQVTEVLEYVRKHGSPEWLHPFLVAAAHTGARRSELLRARVEDFDVANGVVLIREKKKSRGRETFRTVDMTPLLASVVRDYFAAGHPGGVYAFGVHPDKPITDWSSRKAFRTALRGSKWCVLRGYHAFRHSFASNLAAAGIDEHVIAALMGHLTAEMRARYRHLFPNQRRAAVASVFG